MGRKKARTPVEYRIASYSARNLILKAMGFESYSAYLASELWQRIRAQVLKRSPSCFVCGTVATQVHHCCYRKNDLDGRDLSRLTSLCAACHERIEFRDRDGEKLNFKQARAKMRMLRTLRAKQ